MSWFSKHLKCLPKSPEKVCLGKVINYLSEIPCDHFTFLLVLVTGHMDLVSGLFHPWVEAHQQSCIIQAFTLDPGFPQAAWKSRADIPEFLKCQIFQQSAHV